MNKNSIGMICGVSNCLKKVDIGVKCVRCFEWYHQKCSNLTKKNFGVFQANEGLPWMCSLCAALAEACSRGLRTELRSRSNDQEHGKQVYAVSESAGNSGDRIADISSQSTIAMAITSMTENPKREIPSKNKKKRGENVYRGKHVEPKVSLRRPVIEGSPQDREIHPDIMKRIKGLENQVRTLQEGLNAVIGRTKLLVLYNLAEPTIQNNKTRMEGDSSRIRDVLRLAGMSPMVSVTKFHRIGAWKGGPRRSPRPLLVVFGNKSHRDLLLSRAVHVESRTNGIVLVSPEGTSPVASISAVDWKSPSHGTKSSDHTDLQINSSEDAESNNGSQAGDEGR